MRKSNKYYIRDQKPKIERMEQRLYGEGIEWEMFQRGWKRIYTEKKHKESQAVKIKIINIYILYSETAKHQRLITTTSSSNNNNNKQQHQPENKDSSTKEQQLNFGLIIGFSLVTMEARSQWNIFKVLVGGEGRSNYNYASRMSIFSRKIELKLKTSSIYENFSTSSPILFHFENYNHSSGHEDISLYVGFLLLFLLKYS